MLTWIDEQIKESGLSEDRLNLWNLNLVYDLPYPTFRDPPLPAAASPGHSLNVNWCTDLSFALNRVGRKLEN